jgi:hypothetical protein
MRRPEFEFFVSSSATTGNVRFVTSDTCGSLLSAVYAREQSSISLMAVTFEANGRSKIPYLSGVPSLFRARFNAVSLDFAVLLPLSTATLYHMLALSRSFSTPNPF